MSLDIHQFAELLNSMKSAPQDPRYQEPEWFDGTRAASRGFLNQCRLAFMLQPNRFTNDRTKVGFMLSHLKGRALGWASPLIEKDDPILADLEAFLTEFQRIFGDPDCKKNAARKLRTLRQGSSGTAEYAAEFLQLVADVNWNDEAQANQFYEGLSEEVKDELARFDAPEATPELIQLSIRIDNRLRKRAESKKNKNNEPWRTQNATTLATGRDNAGDYGPGPMIIDATRKTLTESERDARRRQGLCFYCGKRGHLVASCPSKPSEPLGKYSAQSL